MVFLCYKITNTINGKVYIGITRRTLADRWRDHLKPVKYNLEQNTHLLHLAIKKYGEAAFLMEEIGRTDNKDDIKEMEQRFIQEYNSFYAYSRGYNMTLGGDGTAGHIITEEHRQKMSEAHKGRSNGPHTEETKQKISETHKANNHKPTQLCIDRRKEVCEGVPRSEDVKQRIRNTLKGRPRPPEVIAKIQATKKMKKLQQNNG
jgi:group I intron endonuclease